MLFMIDIPIFQYGDGFWVCPLLPHHLMPEVGQRKAVIRLQSAQ
jgi:hypothetical protein